MELAGEGLLLLGGEAQPRQARDAPDLVFHLGDYIYEGAGRDGNVRRHAGTRLIAVEHYRVRYAQYRTDLATAIGAKRIYWTDPANWMNQVIYPGPNFRYRYVGESNEVCLDEFVRGPK